MARRGAGAQPLRGTRIATVAQRVFAPDSFALLIEPAIADLQFESGPRSARARAYAAVWVGVAAAFEQDAWRRMRAVLREEDLLSITGLVLLHAFHSTWMVVLLLGLDGRVNVRQATLHLLQARSPVALAASSIAVVLAIYAAAACLSHRGGTMRSLLEGQRGK